MAISDYDTNANNNTTISGIDISEGCSPAGINNALRQIMADIKAKFDTLDVGSDVQAYNTTLTALAGLAGGADKLPYFTDVDTLAQADLTAFARTLLDDADAETAKTTLGLGGLSSTTTELTLPGGQIIGYGAGSPEGIITASVGSIYLSTDRGRVFTKRTGTGNTGWQVDTGAADLFVSSTGGGSFTNNGRFPLNTVERNVVSGASLASNRVTFPAGTYEIEASAFVRMLDGGVGNQTGGAELYNFTDSAAIKAVNYRGAFGVGGPLFVSAVVTFASATDIEIRMSATSTGDYEIQDVTLKAWEL